ncbi:MAG: hypothetical protein RLN81_11290 [Balneolaceae bacterium]
MRISGVVLTLLVLFEFTSPTERILFSSSRDGNSNIYIMDGNGNNIQRITESEFEEWGPVWVSTNEISFLRQKENIINLVLLNLETGKEQLIEHPSNCLIDDKNIQYSKTNKAQLYTCKGNVFLLKAPNTEPFNLTEMFKGQSLYAEWIDEEHILFTNNVEGNNELYQLNTETKESVNLSNSPANDERGSVSPDGEYLLYSSDRYEKGNQEIVLQRLSDGTTQNISESSGTELIARWNKDGTRIYYGSNKDGNWEIYSYELENGTTTRLTKNDAFDGDPRINYH